MISHGGDRAGGHPRFMYSSTPVAEPSTFYKSFSEKKLTSYGSSRRGSIEQHRLALLHRYKPAPGDMVEIGPGHGTLAEQAVAAGWRYTAIEASPILHGRAAQEGPRGHRVVDAADPGAPTPAPTWSTPTRCSSTCPASTRRAQFIAEALRALRPGGVFFVVVPDYLKERTFFWDVDYTHNFVTTERRVQAAVQRRRLRDRCRSSAASASRPASRAMCSRPRALLVNIPGVDALSRYTGHRRPAVQDPQEPVRDADVRRPQAA